MGQVDLHIHSTASDGKYTPAQIVQKAAALGLTVIALADHDTVDGVPELEEAALVFPGMKVIPAVEISTDIPRGEIHMLGYFIDYNDADFQTSLLKMRDSRIERAKGMVQKLDRLGIHVEWSRVRELAGGSSVGRPHIAQAMLEKGYINTLRDAFTRYISRDGPAYVEREKMTPAEALKLITKAGGLPTLAHPLTINYVENMLAELVEDGLAGLEVYYGGYTPEQINYLSSLAGKHNLIPTGGSDYHGLDETSETVLGGAPVPLEAAERLMAAAPRNRIKGNKA